MSSPQPTLAFVYDRCATQDTTELERRLKACGEYVIAQGWGFGGWWRDAGDYALTNDRRPAFDTLLRTMRAAEGCERVCVVYSWERLSRDMAARGLMTRRVLLVGGWVETCGGEKRTPGGRITGPSAAVRADHGMKAGLAAFIERRGGCIAVIGVYVVVCLVDGVPLYLLLR